MSTGKDASASWHTAFPPPRTQKPLTISRAELRQLLDHGNSGQEFILFDLRRTDHEGGTIRGSINIPAQTMYNSIPTLYALIKDSSVRQVIWYCGSSRGRGTRAAGWFANYCEDKGNMELSSKILLDGIKGWATAGKAYTDLMDGYVEESWF